jgi:hypothetical protein
MKGQLNIETIFAFVLRDDDGTEGIPATLVGPMQMPLVGADMDRVASLEPIAQQLANASGKTIELVQFTTREHLKTIEPNRSNPGVAIPIGSSLRAVFGGEP